MDHHEEFPVLSGRWSVVLHLAGWAVFAAGSLFLSLTSGVGLGDESWFLRVVDRVAQGELLYRDVWYAATPLAVYVQLPFVALFGAEVLALKALVVTSFVGSAIICWRIAGQLGLRHDSRALLILGLLLFSSPGALPHVGLYQPLASLFLLLSFSLALSWRETVVGGGNARGLLAAAAGAAALAFSAKQTVGVLAVAALATTVLARLAEGRVWSGWTRSALLPGAVGFAAPALALSAPFALGPSGPSFFSNTVGVYLGWVGPATLGYLDGLGEAARLLARRDSWEALKDVAVRMEVVVAPAAFAMLAVALGREPAPDRSRAVAVTAFAAASFATVFPRTDDFHFAVAMPAVLLGGLFAWERVGPRPLTWTWRLATVVAASLLALGLATTLVVAIAGPATGRAVLADVPHIRNVFVERERLAHLTAASSLLAQRVAGEPVFILTPHASIYYLLSGAENPTPFDYPLVTALGPEGEDGIIAAIERGRLSLVCLPDQARLPLRPLRPLRLEGYVQERLMVVSDAGACVLYRRTSS